ncbi:MAG: TerC family protein [Planctomycetes bacterium]|nr:TerC family protein [Planctomycetota bacterium]
MPPTAGQDGSTLSWVLFVAFVLVMLALDLGVFQRQAHLPTFREALGWTGLWAALACAFGIWIACSRGATAGTEFFTGYVIELSLSMDNVFVFLVIFGGLAIPKELQHRVLFWGVLSALVLRGAMILGGAALVSRYEWILYGFGAFLVWTGIRMLRPQGHAAESGEGRLMAFLRRRLRLTTLHGSKFVVRVDGKLSATPLLLALVMIELSDVVFAVDSIPAIFAVTRDPYLVFTANVFAILGLRSLFFVLAGMLDRFRYLKYGLAIVLTFVGTKLLLLDVVHLPPLLSLSVVLVVLSGAIGLSWFRSANE